MLFSDLRMATTEKTLHSRLMIHWNGVPTAKFNPRSAVQTFLTMKDRRMNLPKVDSYCERDFFKNSLLKRIFHFLHLDFVKMKVISL